MLLSAQIFVASFFVAFQKIIYNHIFCQIFFLPFLWHLKQIDTYSELLQNMSLYPTFVSVTKKYATTKIVAKI